MGGRIGYSTQLRTESHERARRERYSAPRTRTYTEQTTIHYARRHPRFYPTPTFQYQVSARLAGSVYIGMRYVHAWLRESADMLVGTQHPRCIALYARSRDWRVGIGEWTAEGGEMLKTEGIHDTSELGIFWSRDSNTNQHVTISMLRTPKTEASITKSPEYQIRVS